MPAASCRAFHAGRFMPGVSCRAFHAGRFMPGVSCRPLHAGRFSRFMPGHAGRFVPAASCRPLPAASCRPLHAEPGARTSRAQGTAGPRLSARATRPGSRERGPRSRPCLVDPRRCIAGRPGLIRARATIIGLLSIRASTSILLRGIEGIGSSSDCRSIVSGHLTEDCRSPRLVARRIVDPGDCRPEILLTREIAAPEDC